MTTPIEDRTALEMAEVANAAQAVEDRRVADAQVAASKPLVEVPAVVSLDASPPAVVKPTFVGRVKADLQADLLAVETAFKKVEDEV